MINNGIIPGYKFIVYRSVSLLFFHVQFDYVYMFAVSLCSVIMTITNNFTVDVTFVN